MVVGVNCFEDGESSPLISKIDGIWVYESG